MRLCVIPVIAGLFWSAAAVAEVREPSPAACEKMLIQAELKPDASVYEACRFDDEVRAWNTWAPFASSKKLKRALYEFCWRYPEHPYRNLYCEKSAHLRYPPAMVEMGMIRLRENNLEEAQRYFSEALKTGELSAEETNTISEQLGLLYTTEDGAAYQPEVGLALLSKAALNRSAVANNALGYYYFAGKHGLAQNLQEALICFWRAILLGCPAAEENLGAFHLARQKKVSDWDVLKFMEPQVMSCEPAPKGGAPTTTLRPNCPCADIRKQDAKFRAKKYLYVSYDPEPKAVLRDLKGAEHSVKVGSFLPDGSFVSEIRPRAMAIQKDNERILINRYHTGSCVTYCLSDDSKAAPKSVYINPYRLSFSPQECSDIMYYAKALVDTSLPFTGKEECKPADKRKTIEVDEAAALLLGGVPSKDDSVPEVKKAK